MDDNTYEGYTYGEVGATRDGRRPAGYRHLSYRTRIGTGVLAAAGDAVLQWRMHRATGAEVTASASQAAPDVRVVSRIGVGPLRLVAPCRVVWTVEEPDRKGFGYGTLPGHPFRGEEAFVVTRDAEDQVWLTITAFSRPARWYSRLAGPSVGLFQRAYARRCAAALRRVCR